MSKHFLIISELSFRQGPCEVCTEQCAVYTCPRCEIRTCSVKCVQDHKSRNTCSGIRDRTKFVRKADLTEADLLNGKTRRILNFRAFSTRGTGTVHTKNCVAKNVWISRALRDVSPRRSFSRDCSPGSCSSSCRPCCRGCPGRWQLTAAQTPSRKRVAG